MEWKSIVATLEAQSLSEIQDILGEGKQHLLPYNNNVKLWSVKIQIAPTPCTNKDMKNLSAFLGLENIEGNVTGNGPADGCSPYFFKKEENSS